MSFSSSNRGQQSGGVTLVFKKIMAEELEDVKKPAFWRAVFAEFLGCVLLVFFGVGAGLHEEGKHGHSSVHIILTAGFFIAVIISALANVSGAHVNPALSIGFAVTREISFARFIFYAVAQSAGAVAGAALLKLLTPPSMAGNLGLLQPAKNVTVEQALIIEMIISFFLVFVVFALIDKGRKDVSGSIPFVIGLTVCVDIFFAGHISGGCINPIRNFGPAVITGRMELQWIYWVGPMVGGVLGSLLYSKIFSVASEKQGILNCILSRSYEAVSLDDTPPLEHEIEVSTNTSCAGEIPKKIPVDSVERLSSV